MLPSGHLQHKRANNTWVTSSTQQVATSRTQAPRIIASFVRIAPQTSSYSRTRIYSGVTIGATLGSCGYTSHSTYVITHTVIHVWPAYSMRRYLPSMLWLTFSVFAGQPTSFAGVHKHSSSSASSSSACSITVYNLRRIIFSCSLDALTTGKDIVA